VIAVPSLLTRVFPGNERPAAPAPALLGHAPPANNALHDCLIAQAIGLIQS
jgi:hypothetical protein